MQTTEALWILDASIYSVHFESCKETIAKVSNWWEWRIQFVDIYYRTSLEEFHLHQWTC